MFRIKSHACTVAISFAALFATVSSSAQSTTARGTLAGNVADAAGGVLPGARITLDPNGPTAVADEQGAFFLTNLAPGAYTVKIDALGFQSFTDRVTITSGAVTTEHAVVKVSADTQSVEVYAGREHGEVESMNQQQSAENILEVLPAEVINSLPNVNIADAVGRLPGVSLERDEGEGKYVQIRGTEPRLSNVTVDGVNLPSPESAVRNIKMDAIPSFIVDSIQVSKTLTSNQDGDGIGGTVNLVTRIATDKPFFAVLGMGGHTPIIYDGGSNIDEFAAAAGKRFGANHRFGMFGTGSYDFNGRGIDDIEPAAGVSTVKSDPSGALYAVLPTADFREYHYNRSRYGAAGSVDYQFSPTTSLVVRGLFSEFQDYGGKWIYTPNINSWDTPTTSSDPSNNFTYTDSPRNPNYQVGNVSATWNKATGPWLFAAQGAVSRSRADNEDFPSANFQGPSGIAFSVDRTNPYRPNFNILSYSTQGANIYDPTQYAVQSVTTTKDHSAQLNLQASSDVSHSYNWNGHLGTWQTGFKIRNAHKFDDVDDIKYSINDASPFTLSNVESNYHTDNYYDGTYDYYTKGRTSNWNAILAALNANASAFTPNPTVYGFNLHEMIPGQYFMNTINFNRFRVVAGLRLEETLSNSFTTASTLGKVTNNYVDFMPNAQVQYNFTRNSDIRFVYGRGVARPNYGDLVPKQTTNGTNHQVSEGNPYLLSTRSNNFDILGEKYLNTVGVVQAGFFFKQLSNPIVTTQHILTSGPFTGYVDQQPINLPGGHIGGVEFSWEQHFKSLPGALQGLGIFANYGYSFSQATFSWVYADPNSGNPISAYEHRALPRQAPNTYNLNPTFDMKSLSVRLGVSYNEANIYAYNYAGIPGDTSVAGPKGPTGDNYLYGHTQIDSQISYRMPYGFKLTAAGLNLKNEVFGFYQGSSQYPIQREYYHPTYSGSLTWTSSSEK
jgi:TonB-dependent receptor